MHGILLVTHSGVGEALLQCVTHIYGSSPEGVEVCAVHGVDDGAKVQIKLALERVRMLSGQDSAVIFTDVYGASPSNMAAQLVEPGHVVVVSGVNVPMLLRALSYRREPLDVLCQKALEGGVRGIVCTTTLPEKGLQS